MRKNYDKGNGAYPSEFFSVIQLHCSRLLLGLLKYDSRLTLIRLDHMEKIWTGHFVCLKELVFIVQILGFLTNLLLASCFNWFEKNKENNGERSWYVTRPHFLLWSSRIRVNVLLYDNKITDKREQYDWKNMNGNSCGERKRGKQKNDQKALWSSISRDGGGVE